MSSVRDPQYRFTRIYIKDLWHWYTKQDLCRIPGHATQAKAGLPIAQVYLTNPAEDPRACAAFEPHLLIILFMSAWLF